MDLNNAVVLFSGGQDSTTCLAWAMREYGKENILTVSFDYGQKHAIEQEQAKVIARILDVPEPVIFPIPALSILGGAALTDTNIEVEAKASCGSGNTWASEHGLPSTFVPGRNVIFLATAAAYAAKNGIHTLVTGVCEADDAGYPDCRQIFIESMQRVLTDALDALFFIEAPLLSKSKALTFQLASDLEILDIVVEYSHTCYNGDRSNKFDWGYGCGHCPACLERARGWSEWRNSLREANV